MSVRLTLVREYPVDGNLHGAVVYRVAGLPEGQRATIESHGIRGDCWRAERFVQFEGARYMGEYPSAEAALAALQAAIDKEIEAKQISGRVTELERRAIQALINAGRTPNAWASPIHGVDRELDLTTAQSRALVDDLLRRRIVKIRIAATNKLEFSPGAQWWELGDSPAAKGE